MCIHCVTKRDCTSQRCVLNSTHKAKSCSRASDSLKISKDIFQKQPDEVKKAVCKLQAETEMSKRGYHLYAAYDKSVGGETVGSVVKNYRAVSREQRERYKKYQAMSAEKRKQDFKKNPECEGLYSDDLTDLHLKQIQLYHRIGKDLERLAITRRERAEEATLRYRREAEKAELREKLKDNSVKKASVSEEGNSLKRAERKKRALEKKQREQAAKAEIKLNQVKLQNAIQTVK